MPRGHRALVSPRHLHPSLLTPGQGGRAHSAPLSPPSWNHGHSLPCCAQPWMEAEPARFWLPYMNH